MHISHCTYAWLLLCTPLPTVTSADNADLNEAVTKLNLKNEINAYITLLCKDVIHLLELGALMVRDRPSLVEKCLTFYNLLLDFKYPGKWPSIWHCIASLPKFQIIACTLTHAHNEYPDVVMCVLVSLMHAVKFSH